MTETRIHTKGDKDAPRSGTFGQISFRRLVDLMRAAGDIGPNERCTDLVIDVHGGVISYKIETQ